FIGLTETAPEPPLGFKITDPAEAARRASEAARKEADVLIALARVNPDEASRIAKAAPLINVLIATYADTVAQFFTPPTRVGNTDIVFNCFETRMLGELRFYHGPEGRLDTRLRYITLDDLVPDDKVGITFVGQAQIAEEESRTASKKQLET